MKLVSKQQLTYFLIHLLGKKERERENGRPILILNVKIFFKVFIQDPPIHALKCIDSTGYLTFNTYFVPDSVSCSYGEHFCEVHYI